MYGEEHPDETRFQSVKRMCVISDTVYIFRLLEILINLRFAARQLQTSAVCYSLV